MRKVMLEPKVQWDLKAQRVKMVLQELPDLVVPKVRRVTLE